MDKGNKTVYSNVAMQYGFVAARYVFPLILLPYLARCLGSESYGIYAYIVSMMLFVQTVADFGFNQAATKEIVENRSGVRACCEILTSATCAKSILVLVAGIIVLAVSCQVELVKHDLSCVFVAFAGVVCMVGIPDFVFMGFEKMGVITGRFVASKTVSTSLILVFVRGPEDLLLLFCFDSLASLFAASLSWAAVVRRFGLVLVPVSLQLVARAFFGAFPFFVSTTAVAVFNALATILIGVVLDDATQVAYWSVSVTAINAVLSLYNPIANALYPYMVHSGNMRLFLRFFIAGTFAAAAGSVLFACLSGYIMFVLGGEGYVAGSFILVDLAPVLAFAYPALMLGNPLLGAAGESGALARSSTITAVIYTVGLLALIVLNVFTIQMVCVCRCLAEICLGLVRVCYARKAFFLRGPKGIERRN